MQQERVGVARPTPAESAVWRAVREWHDGAETAAAQDVWVAVSGGADSMALADAILHDARTRGLTVHGLTVDHGLQPGSAEIATRTAGWLRGAGCATSQVIPVQVGTAGGTEAAARDARYAALREAADGWILLGHTLDDQAESVLLGLGRGSGPRSIRGMTAYAAPYGRPLLEITRAQTRDYCQARGLPVWDDPHNTDPRYTRVRLRQEVLPLLDDVLGGGVAAALARTAAQLQTDDAEQTASAILRIVATDGAIDARALAAFPQRWRARVIKAWLDEHHHQPVTAAHVAAVDRLIAGYTGQGPAYLPGGGKAVRDRGRIELSEPDQTGRSAPRPRPSKD